MHDKVINNKPRQKGTNRMHRFFVGRGLAIIRRHPEFVKSYLRFFYRMKLGVPFEQRFRNGYAAQPARIQMNLTRRCNLKCLMCTQHRHTSDHPDELPWYDSDRELSVDAWISLLEQAAEFRPFINISGGEPMVYPGFAEVIQAIGERSMPFEINTNGMLLTNYADMLVENGIGAISISIDGPEETHDHIRGRRGLFRRTVEGMEMLAEARRRVHSPLPIIQLACTISKSNIGVLDEMVPLAIGLRADVIRFQHTEFNTPANIEKHNRLLAQDKAAAFGINVLQPSIPEGEYYQSEIGPEDAALVRESLRKAKQQAEGRIKAVLFPNISLDEIESYYMDIDFPPSQHCHGLWTNLRIMPDGTFSPCLHVSAGNITEQPIRELWEDPGIRSFRRIISRRLFPGCARCCYRRF